VPLVLSKICCQVEHSGWLKIAELPVHIGVSSLVAASTRQQPGSKPGNQVMASTSQQPGQTRYVYMNSRGLAKNTAQATNKHPALIYKNEVGRYLLYLQC
jgi:hypothetical protein